MGRNRLEAFSDGVIAIIITIMVLELKVPHGDRLVARCDRILPGFPKLRPVSSSTSASTGTTTTTCSTSSSASMAPMLWANLHLLFWLSLIPFVTGWMGENHFEHCPLHSTGPCYSARRSRITPHRACCARHPAGVDAGRGVAW